MSFHAPQKSLSGISGVILVLNYIYYLVDSLNVTLKTWQVNIISWTRRKEYVRIVAGGVL